MSLYAKDRHKRAVKMLGYALTLATNECWRSTADVWTIRLTLDERYALALAALTTLPFEDAEQVLAEVMGGAGMPLPPFLDPLSDAQWWADLANPAERRAYCLAAFMSMTKREQRDFLEFAEGVAA